MSGRYKIRHHQGIYYLTGATVGWVDLFTRQCYRDIVLDSWRYCQQHKEFLIHGYCLMPDHWHLIASCGDAHRLGAIMRDWKAFTARQIVDHLLDLSNAENRRDWLLHMFGYFAYGKKNKQTYQIWQGDNHPMVLYSEVAMRQKMNDLHQSPVAAGLVTLPEHWLYSSAGYYAAVAEGRSEYPSLIEIAPMERSLTKSIRHTDIYG